MKKSHIYIGIVAVLIGFVIWRAYVMVDETNNGPAKEQFEMGVDVGRQAVRTATGGTKLPSMAEIDDFARRSLPRESSTSPGPSEAFIKGYRKGFIEEYNYRYKPAQ